MYTVEAKTAKGWVEIQSGLKTRAAAELAKRSMEELEKLVGGKASEYRINLRVLAGAE